MLTSKVSLTARHFGGITISWYQASSPASRAIAMNKLEKVRQLPVLAAKASSACRVTCGS